MVGVGTVAVGGSIFPLPFPFFGPGPGGAPSAEASGAAGGAGSLDWEAGSGWALSLYPGMSAMSPRIWEGGVGGGPGGWAPEEQVEPRATESEPIRLISAWRISGLGAPSSEAA